MKSIIVCLVLLSFHVGRCASFENLKFDDARIDLLAGDPPTPPTGGPAVWLLPSWDVSNPSTGWNRTEGFVGSASILDSTYRNTTQPASPIKPPVVGTYSLGIWPESGSRFEEFPFTLKQTGEIPADAQSLRFLYAGPGDFKVYVGGAERLVHFTESLPSADPEVGSLDYFVVDVGLFAGQTAELRFEFFSFGNYPGQDGGPFPGRPDAKFHVLDDLSFSPLPAVPEPTILVLLGVGAGLAWQFGRRR